ncbi:PQQ-binding-like beta-propeller repeat protein [Microlunatus parietis]|uniref:PQQ-like domain-containing protein n=1 Tax=Microlunatus parietis TaxID=682979 RepID=A0A7Y9IG23_9ACTN|nr:PQQ-binding-like beta-propeller repeat protein [Microlunatus parietis]NYE75559.1 hypothetical protein [Microlunatus parietis]
MTGRWPDPPSWPAWQPPRPTAPRSRTPAYVPIVVIGVVVVLLIAAAVVAGRSVAGLLDRTGYADRPRIERPTPRPSAPPVPERPVTVPWRIEPGQLRPDLTGAEFVGPVDGDFSGPYVSAVDPKVADIWVALTGDDDERGMVAHGLDPATGRPLWDRPMEGGLCATEADRRGVACAELLDRDPATGLGRRWRLHLLDPRTGEPRISREVAGWFSALHRSGDTLVVLEQREPAPHAVLHGFDLATLKPRWELDLNKQPGHGQLFSENRIIARKDPDREGVVMDRPRFRDVGYGPKAEQTGDGGLVALWAGQRTAFVQPRTGKLIMMPRCSRLVDDGSRLWCNEPDGARAYSYAGQELLKVTGPRLAFPGDDGVGVDRNRPIFINEVGAPVAVDPETGKVGRPYSVPGSGSAFGQTTMPGAETVGEHTLLVGEGGAMLVDPKQDKITWINEHITHTDTPILIKDELLLGAYRADVVDLATGERRATAKLEGLYTVNVGERIAGVGPDLLCVQQFG